MDWQPIETAPKDELIVVYGKDEYVPGSMTMKITAWSLSWGWTGDCIIPTHWMPLPDPPEAK